jgi:hypothetical protein
VEGGRGLNTLTPYLGVIKAVGGLILAAFLAYALWAAYDWAYDNGANAANVKAEKVIAQMAKAEAKAQADARAKEQASVEAMAAADAQHQKELQDAKDNEAATVAGLRSGNLKLRKLWLGCRAPSETGASVSGADEEARLREEAVARVLRIGAEADAQIRGLQAVIEADRRR